MKNIICSFLIFGFTSYVSADSTIPEELIHNLSSCDALFFKAMKKDSAIFEEIAPLIKKNDIAFWKVEDRWDENKSMLLFKKPIEGKLKLTGYFDDIIDLKSMGIYYSWGFIAEGSPENIAKIIKPFVIDGSRLHKDGEMFVRSEIRDVTLINGDWIKDDNLKGGTIPRKNTVERVFLIEDAEDISHGLTRISCSLQGTVTEEILKNDRPDIDN